MDETATMQAEHRTSAVIEIVPLDERIFETEVRRLDSKIDSIEKSQEKSKTWMEEKFAILQDNIVQVRVELKQDIAQVRTELGQVRTELKQDIVQVRTELKEDIARVSNRIWWVFGAVVLSILVPIALQYFRK